jgi:hypothetical protein
MEFRRFAAIVGGALVLVGLLAGCAGGPVWPVPAMFPSPADAYLDAVQPEVGNENLALEAGYLSCAMAYNAEGILTVTYTTPYQTAPFWWYRGGPNPYEKAALTYLCPRRE